MQRHREHYKLAFKIGSVMSKVVVTIIMGVNLVPLRRAAEMRIAQDSSDDTVATDLDGMKKTV